MTVSLRFTDGTTTVTLSNGTTGYLLRYLGRESPAEVPEVTDAVDIILLGGTAAARTTIESINKLFRQARRRNNDQIGARVFVERDPGTGTFYRSEITDAVPISDDLTFDMGLASGKIPLRLNFTRKNWWEGALATLPLTNSSGTDLTGGIPVYNTDDATYDNYVEIDAADVDGDLPAPTQLLMTNSRNDTDRLAHVWIGQNWTDPDNVDTILEAEDATGGTLQSAAGTSNGQYKDISVTSSEATALTWTLTSAQLDAAAGRPFKCFIYFYLATASVNTTKYRIQLKYQNTLIWDSGQVLPDSSLSLQVVDIGTFFLPPWLQNQTSLSGVDLVLTMQGTGSVTLRVDCLVLLPMEDRGRRWITYVGYGCAYTERIVDDAIDGELYNDDGAGADKVGIYNGYGKQIYLEPGVDQRLYFIQHTNVVYDAPVGMAINLIVKYRPRWLTI